MTRVVAALCWFAEPTEGLERMVRSLAGAADALVAFDGRWERFGHGENVSPLEQAEVIHAAANEIGIPVADESCRADRPWPSQAAKRAAMMREAALHGDWILVVDADETVDANDDFRARLADTGSDVAEVTILSVLGPVRAMRRLFRASAAVTVPGPAHNGYQAGDGRWLKHPSGRETEHALDLTVAFAITNDPGLRSRSRNAAMHRYYRDRGRYRLERQLA